MDISVFVVLFVLGYMLDPRLFLTLCVLFGSVYCHIVSTFIAYMFRIKLSVSVSVYLLRYFADCWVIFWHFLTFFFTVKFPDNSRFQRYLVFIIYWWLIIRNNSISRDWVKFTQSLLMLLCLIINQLSSIWGSALFGIGIGLRITKFIDLSKTNRRTRQSS